MGVMIRVNMGGLRRNSPPKKRGKPIKHPVESSRVFVGSVFRNLSKVLCCKSASQGMVKCRKSLPRATSQDSGHDQKAFSAEFKV